MKINFFILLTIFLIVGCCKKENNTTSSNKINKIKDAAGREVVIPSVIKRVVSPFTMYTRLIVALGGCDLLCGISHSCILPEEEYGCSGTLLNLPDVGPFGANIELIASLKPDIIFASKEEVITFSSKTMATVVSISFPSDTPMLDMFLGQIELIGKVLHLEKNAVSLKKFILDVLEPVTSVTSKLKEEDKPKVYFAWTNWTGDILNTLADFDPIELAGGKNVAKEAKNFAKGERGILVSKEHIIKWNPDVIFLSRFQEQNWFKTGKTKPFPVKIEDVINDPLLQSVNAVKNRQIYYTTAFCNWWPHHRALVQVLYMAKILHPELFKNLEVEEMGNRIFKRFYGRDSLYTKMARDLELKTWNNHTQYSK
ncbi:MAG: ABC transporter substrate-binding protein [Chitinispirillaceae bacterium]|nr:ABC transporter substrate-binding protein [Chitinispirillaceae bacterium]